MIETCEQLVPKVSATVMAIEYGSSPVDAAEHQTRTGRRVAETLQMLGENREVMRLPEKRGEIGRQRIDEALPFAAVPFSRASRYSEKLRLPVARKRRARRE
jgi:hypothetical protein